jgi:transcriptional regulator with XRE-family HTH domain
MQLPQPDGEKITQMRLRKGWTQDDLAEKSGLSRRAIQRMEHCLNVLPKSLGMVAAVLGVTINDLLSPGVEVLASDCTPSDAEKTVPNNVVTLIQTGSLDLEVELPGKLPWDPVDRARFLDALWVVINNADSVKIIRVREGSVRVTLRMTAEQAEQLMLAWDEGRLDQCDVLDIKPVARTGEEGGDGEQAAGTRSTFTAYTTKASRLLNKLPDFDITKLIDITKIDLGSGQKWRDDIASSLRVSLKDVLADNLLLNRIEREKLLDDAIEVAISAIEQAKAFESDLSNLDTEVRLLAVRALRTLGMLVAPILLGVQCDSSVRVRWEVARSLVEIGHTTNDPWQGDIDKRYTPGRNVKGKVIRSTGTEVFVELEPLVGGLLSTRELSQLGAAETSDVVEIGSEIGAKVLRVDARQRLVYLT